ncbi:MAG: DUF389 domain-containing protein [Anaerolineales bacterium]
MSLPEEQPRPEEPTSPDERPEENPPAPEIFAEEPSLPEGFTPISATARPSRARRRRAHRMLAAPGADERAAILDNLARRASPSFEFFLFALLCGAVLGAAYLLDSSALLLLGILLAPLLTPWVGLTLAIQTGSWRFFFLTLGGLLVASLLVFLTGALAGLAGHIWLPLPLSQANFHSHLWWEDLFLVALGAVLLAISFVRSEQKPILPSIMLAYELFLPLSAGGVGLGIGSSHIWPDGGEVFLAHLALATLVGVITMAALRFKPGKFGGYILSILLVLLSLAVLVYYTGLTNFIRDEIIATRRIALTSTPTLVLPSSTPTSTYTPTPSATLTPSDTPTSSATAEPTPSYAVITSPSGGGALVRSDAGGGTVLAVLSNGITIQILPDTQSIDGATWIHIRYDNLDGWVLATVLTATTSTPPPPPSTPTLTPTP